MNGIARSRYSIPQDPYVSQESEQLGREVRRLQAIGSEMGLSTSMTETVITFWPDTSAQRFNRLASTWREECAHLSSIREMVLHPAYQQIVGMGLSALPFLLAELEHQPDHWFWALRAITQDNPVRPEHRGKVTEMARDWLQWAELRGIRP